MAVEARRPGARKARYETPARAAAFAASVEEPAAAFASTRLPRPRPIAVRKRTGERNELKRLPRQARR
jgi:hypothetical protein